MKILFVLELFYPNIGGNESLFLSLGESLVQKGHQVQVVTTRFEKGLALRENHKGIDIIRLPFHNRFAFTFLSFPMVLRAARAADVIHTTSYNAALPAWLASKLSGKKAIITFHEVWGRLWFRLPWLNPLQRILYYSYEQLILKLNFDVFVAVSEYTKEALRQAGVTNSRLTRIYNGLRSEDYQGHVRETRPGKQAFVYTYFGRLGHSKGIDLLMEASTSFLRQGGRKLVFISGDKPRRISGQLRSWIKSKHFEDRVDYIPPLAKAQLKQRLLESDCVLIPSYSEGFCYAAAECIAMGIPVIVSGKAALQEVVSGKFIVMDDMTGNGLLHALEKALNNEWTIMPVKKFLLEDTVQNYVSLYESLSAS